MVINAINYQISVGLGDGSLPNIPNSNRLDVSGDGRLAPIDALIVINRLNDRTTAPPASSASTSRPEGEGPSANEFADQALLAQAADEICLELAPRRDRARR